MSKELNFEKDNEIDVTDLSTEFRVLPSIFYGYSEIEAKADEDYSLRKAEYEELRAAKYLAIKSKEGKITETAIDAMLDIDLQIQASKRVMFDAKRDLKTLSGYVESIRFKKDCLISLGANQRKEM
jgi:hypothetical protein